MSLQCAAFATKLYSGKVEDFVSRDQSVMTVKEACVREQNTAESRTILLYGSAMALIKRVVSDPLYNWANKKGKGREFKYSTCD